MHCGTPMIGIVTALEGLHVTGKYRNRSMQNTCSRLATWDPNNILSTCAVDHCLLVLSSLQRDWYLIAEQPASAPRFAHPEGCAALRIVLGTVPRVGRSGEHLPDGFDRHLVLSSLHIHVWCLVFGVRDSGFEV